MKTNEEIAARVDELNRLRAQCGPSSIMGDMIDDRLAELDPKPKTEPIPWASWVVTVTGRIGQAFERTECISRNEHIWRWNVHSHGGEAGWCDEDNLRPCPDPFETTKQLLAGHLLRTEALPELEDEWEYIIERRDHGQAATHNRATVPGDDTGWFALVTRKKSP